MHAFSSQVIFCFIILIEGKNSLQEGIKQFNKVAAAKFKDLDSDERSRFENLAKLEKESEDQQQLTEKQICNKIANIFYKLREQTVSNSCTMQPITKLY